MKRADGKGLSSEPPHGFHESMTPLRTLNNTRVARGKLALDQASLALDGAVCRDGGGTAEASQAQEKPSCFYAGRVRVSELEDDEKQPLPLGWLLSEYRRERSRTASDGHRIARRTGRTDGQAAEFMSPVEIGEDLRAGIEPPANAGPAPWTAQVEGAP